MHQTILEHRKHLCASNHSKASETPLCIKPFYSIGNTSVHQTILQHRKHFCVEEHQTIQEHRKHLCAAEHQTVLKHQKHFCVEEHQTILEHRKHFYVEVYLINTSTLRRTKTPQLRYGRISKHAFHYQCPSSYTDF